MRKHFIDNLRWMDVFLLIPYHAAQAFNTWGELNYICFVPNKVISSFIVFLSPFFMPLLFLLAGMSSRYALTRRTYGQYLTERIKRLMVPFLFGTLVLCPVLAYIGERTNCGYEGGFFEHYGVFFTKWTDLSGFDGGFGVGQFWFLYFLFVISLVLIGIASLKDHVIKKKAFPEHVPFWALCLMVIPLPFLYDLLAIGGKSFAEYTYVFLIGFFVLSSDRTIEEAKKYRVFTFAAGLAAAALNVYLFLWSGRDYGTYNVIVKAFAEWFMILALIGIGKSRLDLENRITAYLSERSFPLFTFHFLWVVLFQYLFSDRFSDHIVLLFLVPIVCAYAATLVCAEVTLRIPILCFLTGTKNTKHKGVRR